MFDKILTEAWGISKDLLKDHVFPSLSKQRLQFLEEDINKNHLTPETRNTLQEQTNSIIFKKATGIRAGKYKREQIVTLYEYAKGTLEYEDFKKAQRFIKIDDKGDLTIEGINIFEQCTYYINHVIGAFLFFLGVVLFALPVFVPLVFKEQMLSIFLGICLMYFGLEVKAQTFPIDSAKKIKKVIKNYQKDLSNQSIVINNQYCLPPHSKNSKYRK